MSSRGGGYRTSGVTVLANALGIQRNEISSSNIAQPPPLFPPQDTKPLALSNNDDHAYMALVRNEFTNRMRESAYYLKDREPKKDIDRYSDKYRKLIVEPWIPYYNRLPRELWPKHIIEQKETPGHPSKRRKIDEKATTKIDLSKKFETLERREVEREGAAVEEQETSKKKADEEEEEGAEPKDDEQEMSDEDYEEEENDYIQNYFDNGDNYLDDSEENMDDEALY